MASVIASQTERLGSTESRAMAIPDYHSIMMPLLKLAGDGTDHRFRDTVETLARQFGLDESERAELLPSGKPVSYTHLTLPTKRIV